MLVLRCVFPKITVSFRPRVLLRMASMHYSKFEDCCDWRAPFFVVVLAFTFVFLLN